MKAFEGLKKFFTSTVDGHAPIDDPFVQIDRESWIKNLRLCERGTEQGELGLPSHGDESFDVVEADIEAKIGQELNSAQIDARNHTQAYQNRLASCRLLHETGSIHAETKKATGDLFTQVIDWKNKLSNRADAIRESYRDLRQFKRDNGITRPAEELPSKIETIGGIAIAAVGEVFGNSIFLRMNDDLGLIGGVLAAVMVAVVNITLAMAVGYFVWPRTHLKSSSQRFIAWSAIVVWLCVVFVWNLLAAHYRDAKALGLDNPPSAAARTLASNPLGLDGIYSWGLFIIGVLIAMFVARSSYRMDDPFPGYGERERQHIQRCEEYAEVMADAIRDMTGVRDQAMSSAEAVQQQLDIQLRERHEIISAYNRFVKRFDQHQDRLEDAANHLLAAYRDANRKARSNPPPDHFSKAFVLARSEVEPLHITPINEADIKRAKTALTKSIDEIDAAFREAVCKLEPLEHLKAELEREQV